METLELDLAAWGVILSFIAYTIFYTLFIVAQLWWAFALVATGLYCILLIFALQRNEKVISLVCTLFHVIATTGIIGWTCFFFIEIFTGSTVYNWLQVYTKNSADSKKVARGACIAMSVDGLLTSVIMLATAALCYNKVRLLYKEADTNSVYEGTLAVNTEIDFPVYKPTLPRLRTTSEGEIRGQQTAVNRGWESQSARYSSKIYTERF